ncbi:hypothetical protein V1511DRAFT_504070 [Dipodascopsis uninucleata]
MARLLRGPLLFRRALNVLSESTPSLGTALDKEVTLIDKSELLKVARAIGCEESELKSFPKPSDPTRTFITHPSLLIKDTNRAAFLEWREPTAPTSLRSEASRNRYTQPLGINEAYKEALEIIYKDREEKYQQVLKRMDRVESILAKHDVKDITDIKDIKERREAYLHNVNIEYLRRLAEINNPEVRCIADSGLYDMNISVFRYLAWKEWADYDRLVLMQRLETMHVIPDTMPTLKPLIDLKLKFPGSQEQWIEPGKILSTGVTSVAPEFELRNFLKEEKLYTIVVVDPDTPDIDNDTFSTTLHYVLTDVKAGGNNTKVDKLTCRELVSYIPPHPEKNTGYHRYAVWVFEQKNNEPLKFSPPKSSEGPNEEQVLNRSGFNIRVFRSAFRLKSVGAHLWRCKYDSHTDRVREQAGLGEGTVFYRTRLQHYDE